MASLITKRQQARNEKALQELISTVAGNERCADCEARNPGWASWSLGIFLCMRCAGLHRKLGTHVSKVKSLSMDSWNTEQVDTMKRVGNTTSNRTFNPKNVRPQLPADVDEAGGAMERFIRQKYEHKAFVSGVKPVQIRPGSVSSDDQPPPPLPPKPGKKFGFGLRSTSSTLAKVDRHTPPISPIHTGSNGSSTSLKANKQSRVLGSNLGNFDDGLDAKLAALRDMGFKDNNRNLNILKSMDGDVTRAIEALVKLGDSGPVAPGTITPVSAGSAYNGGLAVQKTRQVAETSSANVWDQLDAQQPQRAVTTPQPAPQPMQTPGLSFYNPPASIPASQPLQQHNPHMLAHQMAQLNMAQHQQTGSLTTSPPHNPFFPQSSAAPLPNSTHMMPSQIQTSASPYNANTPFSAPVEPPPSNPFLRRVQSQTLLQSNPWGQQQSPSPAINPWQSQQMPQNGYVTPQQGVQTPQAYPPVRNGFFTQDAAAIPNNSINNPFLKTQAQQTQVSAFTGQQMFTNPAMPLQSPTTLSPQAMTPIQQTSPYQAPPGQQQYFPQHQQTYPPLSQSPAHFQTPQPAFKHDKSSILALYNQPHLAPQPTGFQQQSQQQQANDASQGYAVPQRSATMPVSSNPFAAMQAQEQAQAGASYSNGVQQQQKQQQQQQQVQSQDAFSALLVQRPQQQRWQ